MKNILATLLGILITLNGTDLLAQYEYEYEVENAFPHLQFTLPIGLANDGLGRLYVVEQTGQIHGFRNDSTATESIVLLDLSDIVHVDNEAGLLSVVFHPDFESNGYFYVYYIVQDPLRSILSRFTVKEDNPYVADEESELIILEFPQPTDRHNGGGSAFGPDGYLYFSLGDGSMGRDVYENGQDLTTLLATIIRIDVDNVEEGKNYGIPADNPFVGNTAGYREEIFAYGFRNPWRFSIDMPTGNIWVGDVGEESWEEVNLVVKGGNYGWPVMEGRSCYNPPEGCLREGLIEPVHTYGHDVGRSVTGGFVYRGSELPELAGQYIFGDWGERQVFALEYEGDPNQSDVAVRQIADSERHISSFGVDENDELYMTFTFVGTINRLKSVSDTIAEPPVPIDDVLELRLIGPNPFNGQTHLELQSSLPGHVVVTAHDVLGREVDVLFDANVALNSTNPIILSGKDLPSGVYFIRAVGMDAMSVERVVLAR